MIKKALEKLEIKEKEKEHTVKIFRKGSIFP